LKVILKYDLFSTPVIKDIKILSKPTNHCYVDYVTLTKILKLDSLIVLTSRGIVIGHEAVKLKIGGKLLCSIF